MMVLHRSVVCVFFFSSFLFAQSFTAPREIQAPDVLSRLLPIREYTGLGLTPQFEVKGDTRFAEQFLVADTIVFQPGSQLSLNGPFGDRNDIYIVARKITVLANAGTQNHLVPRRLPAAPSATDIGQGSRRITGRK
jgi:hypothetical protein